MEQARGHSRHLWGISRIVGGGLIALFCALIIAALTFFGIINATIGHVCMALAWGVGSLVICTEIIPGKAVQHKVWSIVGLGMVILLADVGLMRLKKHQDEPEAARQSRPTAGETTAAKNEQKPLPQSRPPTIEGGSRRNKATAARPHNPTVPRIQVPTEPAPQTQMNSALQTQPPSPVLPQIMTFDEFLAKVERERKAREQKARESEPPCRGDDLKQCGDIGLLDWGKPLMQKMNRIADALSLDEKVASERYSGQKFINAMEAAGGTAADDFRDCCAADAVRYHKEMAMRLGGGKQDEQFYQWAEMLLARPRSKEWKAARSDAGRLRTLPFEFHQLEIDLQQKVDHRLIESMPQ